MTRCCDHIFSVGIVFLIAATPFAFGTVHPWAYSAMEAIIFSLVIVWMLKRALLAREQGAWSTERGAKGGNNFGFRISNFGFLGLPLILLVGFCLFQLMPLPPSLLRVISPQTFETYKQILPGWPERYSDFPVATEVGGQKSEVSSPRSSVVGQNPEVSAQQEAGSREQGAKGKWSWVSGVGLTENATDAINPQPEPQNLTAHTPKPASRLFPATWLPLSMAPFLTRTHLLKFVAYVALFFLILFYPYGESWEQGGIPWSSTSKLEPEQRFTRLLVFAVLASGLLVAFVGFVQRFTWNGMILWFFVPYDWAGPAASEATRASGPFINPDHFANYLALIFPLALACALVRSSVMSKLPENALRLFSGLIVLLLFIGILLSLSRGGWISALLGVAVLLWLNPWGGERQRARGKGQGAGSREQGGVRGRRSEVGDPRGFRNSDFGFRILDFFSHTSRLQSVARASLVVVCALLIVSLYLSGPEARQQVDARLGETMEWSEGFGGRGAIWRDSPAMIRDFPFVGVGLGAWPQLFPHYRGGPWSQEFFREAHNDYLQLAAETGLIGGALLAWFFFQSGRRLFRGVRKISRTERPLIAAIVAALAGMAFHEWLDFNLQIPANAFLFMLLLALGLRIARGAEQGAGSGEQGVESMAPWESDGESFAAQWSEVKDQRSEFGVRRSGASRWRSML